MQTLSAESDRTERFTSCRAASDSAARCRVAVRDTLRNRPASGSPPSSVSAGPRGWGDRRGQGNPLPSEYSTATPEGTLSPHFTAAASDHHSTHVAIFSRAPKTRRQLHHQLHPPQRHRGLGCCRRVAPTGPTSSLTASPAATFPGGGASQIREPDGSDSLVLY